MHSRQQTTFSLFHENLFINSVTVCHSCFQFTIIPFSNQRFCVKYLHICEAESRLTARRRQSWTKLWGVKLTSFWNLKWQRRTLSSRTDLQPRKRHLRNFRSNSGERRGRTRARLNLGEHSTKKKNIWQVSLKRVWRNSSAVNIRQRTSGRSWQLDKNGWLVVSVLSLSSPILWWIITGKWVKAASSCVVYVQLTQKLNENVWKSVYPHCSLKDSSKTGRKKN